jgi:hypothetical protein
MAAHLRRPIAAAGLLAILALVSSPLRAQDPVPRVTGGEDTKDDEEATEAPAFQMIRGFITTADRRPARGLLARAKTSAGEQVSPIGGDGRFTIIVPASQGDIELVVDAADPAKRWYYPSWVSVAGAHAGREQGFVLIPRVWQIPQGRYAGQWTEVNLDKAFQWVSPTISHAFYMWQIDAGVDVKSRDRPNSWGLDALPIPVVFDRDSSAVAIEEVDSLGFWKVLDAMEHDFGLDLYRPARAAEFSGDGADADRLIRVWIPDEIGRFIAGRASSDRDGKVLRRGWVTIRRRRWLRDHYLVRHEFMHALGYGHTCAWPTAVSGPGCDGVGVDVSSQFDVAHVEVSLNVNALQRRTGARHGLVAAWNGQKRVGGEELVIADR